MSTTSPTSVKAITAREVLGQYGLRPKKSWGQNFLVNSELTARIAEHAVTSPGGTVIEIGAGLGALTVKLLERAERVIAIERDRDLVRILRDQLTAEIASGRLVLEEADAKKTDYLALLATGVRPHVIAGNLPYQLTGVLLERLAGIAEHIDRSVVLVQAEVAARMVAAPATPEYGALSVFLQAQFVARRAMQLKSGAFYPQPNVDSALVVLEPRRPPATPETSVFRSVVNRAFGQRRKQLKNAWAGLLDAAELGRAAERAHIDLGARGESLTVSEFACMAREIDRAGQDDEHSA
jgi:16S rRNA (adenine1518-N6/adenine1519-N6)-dimethyltransferase